MSCSNFFFRMLSRASFVTIVALTASVALDIREVSGEEKLTIGSKAPDLDISDWLSDRDGSMPHVTKFENGKVYVVEFWATWCGPCIGMMPHLAETQKKYADGVQIVSVSDESVETVKKFLSRNVRGNKEKTYGELTSAYCLTTDPDGSVQADYMLAAGQNGIPTAFIVGKSGHIEWIGHPVDMDAPLAMVVSEKWDRESFAIAYEKGQQLEGLANELWGMRESGRAKDALVKLNGFMSDLKEGSQIYAQCEKMRQDLVMEAGGPDAVKMLEELISKSKNPVEIDQITYQIVQKVEGGKKVSAEMLEAARKGAKRAVELSQTGNDKNETAMVLDTLAHLLFLSDSLDEAIVAQKEAVELSGDKRLNEFYQRLLKAKEKSKE